MTRKRLIIGGIVVAVAVLGGMAALRGRKDKGVEVRLETACVLVCPQHAISIYDGFATVDETRCDLDGICIVACPHQAIHFEEERPNQPSRSGP